MNEYSSKFLTLISYDSLESLSVSLLLSGCFLLYIYLCKFNQDRSLKNILVVGFIIRIVIAIIDNAIILFPYGWDDYYSTAILLKSNILNGYPLFENVDVSIHVYSYALFSSLFYIFFGDHQIIMRLINAFLSVLAAERCYYISRELIDDHKSAKFATIIMLFYPSFIVYSILDMRDSLFIFLSVDALLRVTKFLNSHSYNWFVLTVEIIVLYILRTQNIYLFPAILLTYILLNTFLKIGLKKKIIVLFSVLVFTIILILVATKLQFTDILLDYINRDMRYRASFGGSSYLPDVEYQNWYDILRMAPVRLIYFLFGPFPWMINNSFMLFAFLETIYFTFLLLMATQKYAVKAYYQNHKIYLILFSYGLVGLILNSIIDSNFGTAIRHKLNYIFVFFIFAAISLKNYQIKFVSKFKTIQ